MNTTTKATALAALSTLLLVLGACVDQEPSMSLKGSVAFEGEVEEEDGVEIFTCEAELDPGSASQYYTRASIDIEQLGTVGQIGPPDGAHRWFEFYANITNLLEQSTNVGAGSGDGNFPGLSNDQNAIMITGATVRFPDELNKFKGAEFAKELEKKELFSMVVDSGGGAAIVGFPLFGQRELAKLALFHTQAVTAATGSDDPEAIVPLVAEIQIEGETFSGQVVESNKFRFPVDLCRSCEIDVTPTCVFSR
jgi:hypothetical protein